MTGEDSQLTPDYAVVGEVTEGLATVDRISAEAVDPKASIPSQSADGPPVNPIVIKRATVTPAS
jgi:cyclophilin family peptidyl-prolyl cis-trans isomerase